MRSKFKSLFLALAILLADLVASTYLLFNDHENTAIALLTPVAIFMAIIVMVAIDAYGKRNVLFFAGIGTNNFVILANLGGVAKRYLARVHGHNYNPETGHRVHPVEPKENVETKSHEKQQDFYENNFLNYLANHWDIYYKGLSTKLITPEWCSSSRIPHVKVHNWTTKECKVKGLPYNVEATLTFEQTDLSMYLYLNGSDVVEDIVKTDYESALRAFFAKQGDKDNYDVRKIQGVSTEGTVDPEFQAQVLIPTNGSANKYGNSLTNIAIGDIVPANEDVRNGVEKQALAEINKKAEITEAEGKSKAAKLVGDVRVKIETKLKKAGVDRMALAVEKQEAATTLVIGSSNSTIAIQPSQKIGFKTEKTDKP